jgi:hypothetical protein
MVVLAYRVSSLSDFRKELAVIFFFFFDSELAVILAGEEEPTWKNQRGWA